MSESVDAVAVRRWGVAGLAALRRHQAEIDALNVYPVPDGDTGTNLVLTMTAAVEALEDTPGLSAGAALRRLARGALLGARGNSGVILSQLLRGVAEAVVVAGEAPLTGHVLAEALQRGALDAYDAVADPVEGTILSVAAAAARAAKATSAAARAAEAPGAARPAEATAVVRSAEATAVVRSVEATDAARAAEATPAVQAADVTTAAPPVAATAGSWAAEAIAAQATTGARPAETTPTPEVGHGVDGQVGGALAVARAAAFAAREALARTPQQLPVLARAGVVDAGGRGLVVLLDVLVEVLGGEVAPVAVGAPPVPHVDPRRETGSDAFGYEVQYLLDAQAPAVEALKGVLGRLGDSLVVVGSEPTWHVHIHVNDIGAAVEAGVNAGRPSRISVVRFADQTAAQAAAQPTPPTAAAQLAPATAAGQLAPATAAGQLASLGAAGQLAPPPSADQAAPGSAATRPTPRSAADEAAGQAGLASAVDQTAPATAAGPPAPLSAASQTAPPTATGQPALASPTDQAAQPSPTDQAAQPSAAGQTVAPSPTDQTAQPTATGQTASPTAADQAAPASAAGRTAPPPAADLQRLDSAVPGDGDATDARGRAENAVASTPEDLDVSAADRGVVVVCTGTGLGALFAAEGALVVGGTPSTAEVLAAVRATGKPRVVVLPNDRNVVAVARAAAAEARELGIRVGVVPTRSPVQGLAALAVRDPGRRFEDDVIAMAEAAGACRYAEVTHASREALTVAGRCQPGDVLALVEGEVNLIGQDLRDTCRLLLDRLLAAGGELVTLVTGDGAPDGLGPLLQVHVAERWPFVEVQWYEGGQPLYPLLVGVE